jgi:hypothetical protein
MIVTDLDVLRNESKIVHIGGKDIDVSFIPCAITFDLDTIMQELNLVSTKEMILDPKKELDYSDEEKNISKIERNKNVKNAFELSVRMCALFCEHNYPEMTYEWFMTNTDASQIKKFSNAIRDTLMKAYNGVNTEAKNPKASKKKSR